MRIIGVIPARSGSRRVKDKNIRLLGGKPLIAWTIETALRSPYFHKVIVSTDSEEYATIARKYGAEVPFIRPDEISGDCDTGLVVKHCVDWLEENKGFHTDVAVTLQPTNPFRSREDIDIACQAVVSTGADTVVSVCKVSQHPAWMFRWAEGNLSSYLGTPIDTLSGLIAQDLPELYFPNGVVYATERQIIDQGRIYGDAIIPHIMPHERSIDIEEEFDFKFAEALLQCQIEQ